MKIIWPLILMVFVSCSNQKIDNYKDQSPKLDLKAFFNGKIIAKGIVQNRAGEVIKRFDVNIIASWKENECTIDEKFNYSDNTTGSRVWKLTETSALKYEGRAHDVIGIAKGEVSGNTFFFEYFLDVPVGDSSYKIHFEDWMYLLDTNTLLARTTMSKWGIKVGEVTIVMSKNGNP